MASEEGAFPWEVEDMKLPQFKPVEKVGCSCTPVVAKGVPVCVSSVEDLLPLRS